ncbi:MAG: pyridoxal phosphate-dependent aminotransferase [bacterium]|nr:pyridoxal phosphate-dependent aminotransferase [bacterium]
MEIQYNQDIQDLKQSDIRRMTLECNKHADGINLSQGICDLPLSPILAENVNQAIKDGHNIYTRYDGIHELRDQVSKKMHSFNQVSYHPEHEIVITSGASAAFFLTLFSIKRGHDEIILFQPFYGYHYNTIAALGMKPVVLTMDPDNNWAIDFDELLKNISANTRAILINTPSNPSGKVFSQQEIQKIGEIAVKHNLLLITDEIYEYITYDSAKHISPACFHDIKDRVITIGGFSKTFSITGWRLAYLCGNEDFVKKIGILNDLFYICAPAPLQKAVSVGLAGINPSFYKEMQEYYQKNRDLLVNTLLKKNINVHIPQGAYYLLADFSSAGYKDCHEAAADILKRTRIATVPGASFYEKNEKDGNTLLRFCFAKKHNILKQACERLESLTI